MKKLFLAALLVVTMAASAFAKDTKKVNAAALGNFKVEFKKASDVTWTANENYAKASFILNNERMEAYYNPEGEKIGTSHAITVDYLPVKAKRAFAKKYGDYTVKEAIEFEGTDETAYFLSAENDAESVILKVTDDGLSIYKRTKK